MGISRYMRRILFTLLAVALCTGPSAALADSTPSVQSFTTSPSFVPNGYSFVLSWNLANAYGSKISFSCISGVSISEAGGSNIPCDTPTTVSSSVSGSAGFVATNVSGATRTVTATLSLQNADGTNYSPSTATVSLSVGTSAQPITSFSISSTTVVANVPAILTWTGVDIATTNMQFDCVSGVQIFLSDTLLPCGKPAFTTDLSSSGSLSITARNSSLSPIHVTAHMLPAIVAGQAYDAVHALSTTFTVANNAISSDPIVQSFTISAVPVIPTAPFSLAWVVDNATGANIQFTCASALRVVAISGTTTTSLPCNSLAFAKAFSPAGSTTISVINNTPYGQSLSVTLLPQKADGTYYGVAARTLAIPILPAGTATTSSTQLSPATTIAATMPLSTTLPNDASTSTPAPVSHVPHTTFSASLSRGSRGAEVTALQTFLAQNTMLYPEGLTTGYFGSLTEGAVQRFQEKYSIAKPGDGGYGYVGPKTRAQLNSVETP